jgi:hypothetical protein
MSAPVKLAGAALAFLSLLPVRHAAAAWEPAEVTSTPLHEGVLLKAQFRYGLLPDFSPAGRLRVIRFKGDGMSTSYSIDELRSIGKQLLSRLDDLDALRLAGSTASRPVYFANSRFFLVSAKPAVLAVVPHVFVPPGSSYTTSTLYRLDPQARYHDLFEKERTALKLDAFVARVDEPAWINYVELRAVVPDAPGIRVIGELWDKPVALETAQEDPRWPFRVLPSARFPGYLEFTGRPAGGNKADWMPARHPSRFHSN